MLRIDAGRRFAKAYKLRKCRAVSALGSIPSWWPFRYGTLANALTISTPATARTGDTGCPGRTTPNGRNAHRVQIRRSQVPSERKPPNRLLHDRLAMQGQYVVLPRLRGSSRGLVETLRRLHRGRDLMLGLSSTCVAFVDRALRLDDTSRPPANRSAGDYNSYSSRRIFDHGQARQDRR